MKKYLFNIWYKPKKSFKQRLTRGYPTTTLRKPYHYIVAMIWRLHGQLDGSKFTLSYMPLIYYYEEEGSSFNWDDILSTNLTKSIAIIKES
jgi:hypothetical protein